MGQPNHTGSSAGWLRRGLQLAEGFDIEAADTTPSVIAADADRGTWYLPVRIVAADGAAREALLKGFRLEGDPGPSPETLDRWHFEHAMIASPVRPVPGFPRAVAGVVASAPVILPPVYFDTEKQEFVPAPEAGSGLVAISDRPWGGVLVERFHLPFSAWLRLASGEPWRVVRSSLATWPASLLGALDRVFGGARATILGPENGGSFALETFLLRLEWLRQLLATLRAMTDGPRRPHLGIGPEALAIAVGTPSVWNSPLWTSRVVTLSTGAVRATTHGSFEPRPGRSAALIPPECRVGAAWMRGRCVPRGTNSASRPAKTWDFHFLPSEPSAQTPPRGTAIRFALDDAGHPSGPALEGRIDFAFRDVWTVRVGDPRSSEDAIREMLQREDGRPSVVLQAISEHGLADDLYAVGTLWLSSLVAEPGSVAAAVRLREALCSGSAEASRLDATEASGLRYYAIEGTAPERRLPAELLECALDLGHRLCGGVAGAYPGQGHEPIAAGEPTQVYDGFLAEAAALASNARHRLLGYSPADAEIRALLEGAFRAP